MLKYKCFLWAYAIRFYILWAYAIRPYRRATVKVTPTLFAFCILLSASLLHAQDTKGTDFWLTFGKNADLSYNEVDMQIRIVGGDENATATIYYTDIDASVSLSVAANSVETYRIVNTTFKTAVYNATTGISNRSIHITTSAPVLVYALNQFIYSCSTDATNILPITALGTNYYHISYTVSDYTSTKYNDAYAVIATENNTQVWRNSEPFVTLNKGQVYYGTSPIDMTGDHITTNKPVAYFALHQGPQIPNRTEAVDVLFQQLAPVNTWGKKFLVPVSHRKRDFVRIVASQNGTNITQIGGNLRIVSGGQKTLTNLNAGQWVELEVLLDNKGCFIEANKPVGVCAYLTGADYNSSVLPKASDPAQAWMPPFEQTVKSALIAPFIPPTGTSKLNAHYILIITPTATKDNTRMRVSGGIEQPLNGGKWYDNPSAGTSFYFLQIATGNNAVAYTIANPKGVIVMAYGTGENESYYYLASSSMQTLTAAFYVNDIFYKDLASEILCMQPVRFSAEIYGSMNAATGHLKWYIDNVEEENARDSLTWSKPLADGTYQIRMEILLADSITTETATATIVVKTTELADIKNFAFCTGEAFSGINFTGTNLDIAATTWKVTSGSGIEIGMSADNGTSSIPAFMAVNNDSIPASVEITVTPKSAEGCIGEAKTFTITVYAQMSKINLGNDTTICWLDSLILNAIHPIATHYQWQDGSTGATYTVYYDGGDYWVTVHSRCGKASDTINVSYLNNINLYLGNDTILCKNDAISLTLDVTNTHASYIWHDGTTSPVYIVEQSGTYSVTVSNACISVTDKIEIEVKDCHLKFNIPNIFTPNGDKINDTFGPEFMPVTNLKNCEMFIYDRWGRLVFSSTDYQTHWNGNNKNGRPYADGVYYYQLYVTDIFGQEYAHHGSVMLKR